jgi:hypothetical protein
MWFQCKFWSYSERHGSENTFLRCLQCCGKSQYESIMVVHLNLTSEMLLFGGEKFMCYRHVMNVSKVFHENYLFTILLLYSAGSMMWSSSLYIHRL